MHATKNRPKRRLLITLWHCTSTYIKADKALCPFPFQITNNPLAMKRLGQLILFAILASTNSFLFPSGTQIASTTLLNSDQSETEQDAVSRRQFAELSFAAAGLGISFLGTREPTPTSYGLWGILPVGTYKEKKTLFKEIVPGKIWTLDQKFGILNVQVPLRMTVVKHSDGGLFLYNPVAATPECLDMLKGLIKEHGPLRHIVVGSVALEHKVYAGVMAQKFTKAQVWLTPGQYSFPTNLPNPFLGFPLSRTNDIPNPEDAPQEWKNDFDFLTLGPLISRYVR
jgi:hypothetical protein